MASSKNQEREAREARDRLKRYNARQAVHSHQVRRRKRDNVAAVVGVIVVAALAAATQVFYFSAGPGAPEPSASSSASADPSATPTAAAGENVGDVPSPDVAEARTWTGTMTLNNTKLEYELDGKAAPQAVAAFVSEVEDDYFIDKTCHRLVVSDGFGLIQCGSLDGTGASDPDFSFGPIENAPEDNVYTSGVIAMARAGDDAYSNGRQFFIVFDDSTIPADTAGGYTVIGTVTSGLDDLKADIVSGGVTATDTSTEDGAPVIPTTITALTIK